MRLLDRYILKSVLAVFLGCFFAFIFLYVIADFISRLDDILKHHISFSLIFSYYLHSLPVMLTQTTPIAMVLASIYTFGKLNRDNELIVIRSSGLSLWQVCLPIIASGLLVSASMLVVNEKVIPYSRMESEKIKAQLEGENKAATKEAVINNLTFYGLENRLFFINSFDPKNGSMEGITILEHDRGQNLTAKITAKRGLYKDRLWIFYECTRLNFDLEGHISEDSAYSEEAIMEISETPQDFLQQRKRAELMSSSQLKDYIRKLKKSGASGAVKSLLIDLYQRYASAFTTLALILLGIPFSFVIRKRSNIFTSLVTAFAMSFLYYVLNGISLAIGKAGFLPPFLSCWLVQIASSLFALRLIRRTA